MLTQCKKENFFFFNIEDAFFISLSYVPPVDTIILLKLFTKSLNNWKDAQSILATLISLKFNSFNNLICDLVKQVIKGTTL